MSKKRFRKAARTFPDTATIKPGVAHTMGVPAYLQDHLTRIGGANLLGQSKFRLAWSGNRTAWTTKKWIESDKFGALSRAWFGTGVDLKYPQPARRERFIVEVYRPPFFYGDRGAWYINNTKFLEGRTILPNGPYPSRGDYEYLDTVESVDELGERHFLMPTEAYLSTVVQLYHHLLGMPDWELRDQKEREDERKQQMTYNTILERVKTATDPLFRSPQAAFSNTAALQGSADYLARNATVATL